MSSMIHKVKDSLKGDKAPHDSHGNPLSSGQDGYGTSHTGTGKPYEQSSMPGAFDSTATGTDTTGTQGYGTAHSTDQRHVQGSGLGHENAFQKSTIGSGTD